jgi:hypothetical protein
MKARQRSIGVNFFDSFGSFCGKITAEFELRR